MNGGKQILQLEAKEKQHSSKVRIFFSRLLRLKTSQKELFLRQKSSFGLVFGFLKLPGSSLLLNIPKPAKRNFFSDRKVPFAWFSDF